MFSSIFEWQKNLRILLLRQIFVLIQFVRFILCHKKCDRSNLKIHFVRHHFGESNTRVNEPLSNAFLQMIHTRFSFPTEFQLSIKF